MPYFSFSLRMYDDLYYEEVSISCEQVLWQGVSAVFLFNPLPRD